MLVLTALLACGGGPFSTTGEIHSAEPSVEPISDPFDRFALGAGSANIPTAPSTLLNPRFPTGSSTLALYTGAGSAAVAVHPDGDLVGLDVQGIETFRAPIPGGGADRVAVAGGKILATQSGRHSIVVWRSTRMQPRFERVLKTCAEPFGIVAREDGARFYVACSQDDAVVELDGDSLVELRRWHVPNQPRWLALKPDGSALHVAPALGSFSFSLNLKTGTADRHAIPSALLTAGSLSAGALNGRFTGDPSFSADGGTLVFPALYVDAGGKLVELATAIDDFEANTYYGQVGNVPLQRFNPTVVFATVHETGWVYSEAVLIETDIRSYPASVTLDPLWKQIIAPMSASNTLVVADDVTHSVRGSWELVNGGGMRTFAKSGTVSTDVGPSHVLFTSLDTAIVANHIARNVQAIPLSDARLMPMGSSDLSTVPADPAFEALWHTSLTAEQELGRQLFNSSVDPRVSDPANAVSCSTCHFEHRTDGLTWRIGDNFVQVPSLVTASHTAPYTWFDEVDTVAAEAAITATTRLNAFEFTDLLAIEEYVATFEVPDVPTRGVITDAVERGADLFYDPDVGCSSCHSGDFYTNGGSAPILDDRPAATPGLVGIAATAPYFHDGSAATLRDVLEFSRSGRMGSTRDLNPHQLDDLEAFLRSL